MAAPARTHTALGDWLEQNGGIAHRSEILRAGFSVPVLRGLVRSGRAESIRRHWIAGPNAHELLRVAAAAGGRLTCVSLARWRGWWVPDDVADDIHLHLLPGSGTPRFPAGWSGITHWTRPLAPVARTLLGSVEDALAHIAVCLPRDAALVIWESAARMERLAVAALTAIPWTSVAARELASSVTGLADSGLETLVVIPLRRWGLLVRQQIVIAGKRVDLLIGERLVVQVDGWTFHAGSVQRTKDIAHDAELRLRGYTVIRLSYAQVVHDWPATEALIRRAVAAGLHMPPGSRSRGRTSEARR